MSEKIITIDPSFFSLSRKSKKVSKNLQLPSSLKPTTKINQTTPLSSKSLRKHLLKRIREKRKSLQQLTLDETNNNVNNNNNSMDMEDELKESISILSQASELPKEIMDDEKNMVTKVDNMIQNQNTIKMKPIFNENLISKVKISSPTLNDVPYGILKGGNKPLYRDWTKRNIIDPQQTKFGNINNNENEKDNNNVSFNHHPILQRAPGKYKIKKTIRRKYMVGKKKNEETIDIYIKNKKVQQDIENTQKKWQDNSITDVKHYLKKNKIIEQSGNQVPSELLRDIYSSVQLAGDVVVE